MLPRPLILTGMLGAAVGVPMAVTNAPDSWGTFATNDTSQNSKTTVESAPTAVRQIRPPQGPGSLVYESPAPLEGFPSPSLGEALRMDVTKEWVYARWARKSTGLADPELFGVRVPLVTGHAMTDLAGSLSYYFDGAGRVQKLRFHGRTADTTQIVALARNYYGLTPQQAVPGEQLYETHENGRTLSRLRTRPEPVLWSTTPHESFLVDLEINRPGSGRYAAEQSLQLKIPTEPTTEPPPTEVAQVAEAPQAARETTTEAAGSKLAPGRLPAFRWPN